MTKGEGVKDAISYYTTHQARMDYPAYRARGLLIGSDPVESTCKQLVSVRLKLAGMIWDVEGPKRSSLCGPGSGATVGTRLCVAFPTATGVSAADGATCGGGGGRMTTHARTRARLGGG